MKNMNQTVMLILKKIYITNVNIFVIQYKYINILFLVSIFSLVSVCRNFRPGRLFPFAGGSTAEPAIAGGRASGPAIPSIDAAASAARHEAVYDESNPYSRQLEPVLLAHLTVSYRLNRKRVAHEFALKMLNLTGYKDFYGHRYNHFTGRVEAEREANVIPNISYRIEF